MSEGKRAPTTMASRPVKATATSDEKHPKYREAIRLRAEASRTGKPRGKGKALTDDELRSYIAKARKARPTTTAVQELEIAYWIEGLAVSRFRFVRLWDEVGGSKAAPKKSAAKKSAAKEKGSSKETAPAAEAAPSTSEDREGVKERIEARAEQRRAS